MDNTFIKMCDCEEIQKGWEPKDGDFCWHDDGGEEYLGNVEFPATTAVVHIAHSNAKSYWYNWLWLPTQEQLQEMVVFPDHPYYLIGRFNRTVGEWCDEDYLARGASMEQLWLAFVMKENHSKVWNGNEWVKLGAE